ncbi:MAG: pyridoxamine 5'-phosphate oxidase family protein [Actinomycetales bacterium]|nr:pyridoxamine 5'-phosphate oxidase family protein [Actinomycetales bacterium]
MSDPKANVESMPEDMDQAAALELLREPHVGVLAVATDGSPAAVPLWYDCAPDGSEIWILTGPGTRKASWLERGRSATLVVQTVAPGPASSRSTWSCRTAGPQRATTCGRWPDATSRGWRWRVIWSSPQSI